LPSIVSGETADTAHYQLWANAFKVRVQLGAPIPASCGTIDAGKILRSLPDKGTAVVVFPDDQSAT